jgi:hypothetical protein
MARVRNLHRIDLYCPEYMTNATILIDQITTPANLISWLTTRWAVSRVKCNLPRLFLHTGAMMI